MNWTFLDTWIVLVGFLAAAACALPGCFLVLRRMSLMGDAISHAVLPGLAVALLLTSSLASWPMFLGAVVVGVLTAVFTQWIERLGRVESTAALGIVFTTLFAIGLVLIRFAADKVHIDPDCVLYGAIELTPLNTMAMAGWDVPIAAVTNGAMLLINALFITLFYKELKISSFDPQLATTLGINAQMMHYLLMGLVAATTVAAFESVGSILVIAMLIVPGAVAHLLTDRLSVMLGIALVVAAGCAVFGHVGAITLPRAFGYGAIPTASMMAVAAGAIFLVAMIAGPRYGVLSQALGRLRLTLRIAQQDMLGLLYRLEERGGTPATLPTDQLRTALDLGQIDMRLVLMGLQRRGLIQRDDGAAHLTDRGRHEARSLVRSHRLWATYLDRFAGTRLDHLHLSAERLEHATGAELQRALAERTGSPPTDPQGKAIPGEDR